MKIGIGIPNQVRNVRPEIIPQWAARAEEAGFSTLSTVGRLAFPGVMDTVALAAAAGATSRIGLFSGILLGPVWPARLLAKEVAGIDGVSGGRLTLGLGIGGRPDDFVVEGRPNKGLGKRIDADLEIYRSVWRGEPFGGGESPAVPPGTREVPLIFGGQSAQAFARMARWGRGLVGGSAPAQFVSPAFEGARAAWQEAGREGSPYLVGLNYFALGDPDAGRAAIADYYAFSGPYGEIVVSGVRTTAESIKQTIAEYEEIGADELMLNPGVADLDEIARLAEIVF
ncbi:MAG TPA: LLM class flavin-dependent oxidoreductase [Actinocrinis sp.]|jgi:alkanesulfonate monooxygenase SsuD/methylene tetrahydromethanopterin reductase-like flavin-dependent oxidoreductase (luciferase family)